MLMDALSLTESIPKSGNGRRLRIRSTVSFTACWLRLGRTSSSHHLVATSTAHRVWRYSPLVLCPQWATRSTSKNPGRPSSQSAKVRTGIFFLRRVPGLGGVPVPLRRRTVGTKEAVDGGCAHLEKEFLRFRPDLEHSLLLEDGYDLGKEGSQSLGTDAATGLPDLKAVEVLRLSSVAKKPDGGLTVVTGKGDKFIQDQGFFLAARLKVPGPPGFHKLGYTGLGHRFLLLSVTQFMRNR